MCCDGAILIRTCGAARQLQSALLQIGQAGGPPCYGAVKGCKLTELSRLQPTLRSCASDELLCLSVACVLPV